MAIPSPISFNEEASDLDGSYPTYPDRFDVYVSNNSIDNPTDLGSGATLLEKNLSLHSHDDIDYYLFEIDESPSKPKWIRLTLDRPTQDYDLFLYDFEGNEINYSVNSEGEDEHIEITYLNPGPYYLSVERFSGPSGTYHLSSHDNLGIEAKDFYVDDPVYLNKVTEGLNFGVIYSELVETDNYPNYSFGPSDFEIDAVWIDRYNKPLADIYTNPADAGISVDEDGSITIDTTSPAYRHVNQDGYGQVEVHFTVSDPDGLTDSGTVNFQVINNNALTSGIGPRAKYFDSDQIFMQGTVNEGLNFGQIYSELVHTEDYPQYTFTHEDFNINGAYFYYEDDPLRAYFASAEQAGLSKDETGAITIDTNSEAFDFMIKGGLLTVQAIFTVTDSAGMQDRGIVKFQIDGNERDTVIDQFDVNSSNNSLANATVINDLESIHGQYLSIHDSTDIDFYAFAIDQPIEQETWIRLTPDHILQDYDLYLYDQAGDVIAVSEYEAGYNDNVKISNLEIGQYYLSVDPYSGPDGSYSLSTHANRGIEAKDYYVEHPFLLNDVKDDLNFGTIYSELVYTNDYPYYDFTSGDFRINGVVIARGDKPFDDVYIDHENAGVFVDETGNIKIDTFNDSYKFLEESIGYAQVDVHFTVTDPEGYQDNGIVGFNVLRDTEPSEQEGPRAKFFDSGDVFEQGYVYEGLNFGEIYSELVHVEDYPDYTFTHNDFDIDGVFYYYEDNPGVKYFATASESGIIKNGNGDISIDTRPENLVSLHADDLLTVHVLFTVKDANGLKDKGSVKYQLIGDSDGFGDGDNYQYSGFNSSYDNISRSSFAAEIEPSDYASAFDLESQFISSLSNNIMITFEADNGWLDVNGNYSGGFTPDDHQFIAGFNTPYSNFSPAATGANARTTLVPGTSAGEHSNGTARGTIEYIHADSSQNSGRRVHFNFNDVGHSAGVDEPDLARLNQYSNIDRGINMTSGNDMVSGGEYDQFLEVLPSEQTEGGLDVYFTGTEAGSGDSFSNPINAFGFYLMGRENKRDVYLDVYDIAGNLIYSEPTSEPEAFGEAVVEYIAFSLDSADQTLPIASFSLREEWEVGDGPGSRDIFSIDNLSLEFAYENTQSIDPLDPVDEPYDVELSVPDIDSGSGQSISIPINVSDAAGFESLDLNLSYDNSVFDQPTTGSLITAGSLNPGSSFIVNNNTPGQIAISWAGISPLPSGSGSIATLNLEVKADAEVGSTLIDLVSASINEDAINAELVDGNITLLPPSFQITAIRQIPNGLALQLPEAPDLEAFNLYDGPDGTVEDSDLQLTDSSGQPVALSAHWDEATKELFLLADEPLTPGDYKLDIDSRADGLISASSGELLDGDGDGTGGDALSTTISFSAPEHSLSIADTARGAGQSLNLNGRNTHDSVTGLPVETSKGLPIHLSTSASLTSFSGEVSYDSSLLLNEQLDSVLSAGVDLPADWNLQIDPSSTPGELRYSALGSTPIAGTDNEILRFHATVAAEAAPPARGTTGNGLYGSSTLINASFSSDQLTGAPIAIDPGLVALAYAGDTTGNGTLSSLDASRVQRVVVGLDSGFDPYDTINPVLIGDTTGNGSLSSLDASRIQQQVVGLEVNSFPDIPEL